MSAEPLSSPARRRRDRPAMEAALVDAARRIFSELGYTAATTRQIAAQVGCSEALIQNYFGGKEGLLEAVLRTQGDVHATVDRFMAREAAATLAAEIGDTLSFIVELLGRGDQVVRILVERELVDPAFRGRFAQRTPREQIAAALRERLARDWPNVADPTVATELTVAVGFDLGFVHPNLLRSGGDDVRRRLTALIPVIVRGIDATHS